LRPFLRTVRGGAVLYHSPLLSDHEIPHAFTTRHGGCSRGPYRSFNLGYGCGDDDQAVTANRVVLCELFGRPPEALRAVQQVHGADLADADALAYADAPAADGLYTRQPGLLLSVRVADCLPVLCSTPDGATVAAVHAGWRGLAQGILPRAVARLCEVSGRPVNELLLAIGPAISVARYEVGPEVGDAIEHAVVDTSAGRPHLDLAATAEAQLHAAGVVHVDVARLCTYDGLDFFSHRRDAGVTGRQVGAILPRL